MSEKLSKEYVVTKEVEDQVLEERDTNWQEEPHKFQYIMSPLLFNNNHIRAFPCLF